jgi:hypothetical protein
MIFGRKAPPAMCHACQSDHSDDSAPLCTHRGAAILGICMVAQALLQ